MSVSVGSPHRRVIGAAFADLPPQVRAFHQGAGVRRWIGVCDVRRGKGAVASAVASLFGFPRAGTAIAISVTVTPDEDVETWTRDLGGYVLRSTQWADMRGARPLLAERFGPVRVGSALVPDGDLLRIVPHEGTLFGIPIPRRLLPSGEAFETERGGRFCFDVSIRVPLVGLVVSYRGRLAAEGEDGPGGRAPDRERRPGRAMGSQGPARP